MEFLIIIGALVGAWYISKKTPTTTPTDAAKQPPVINPMLMLTVAQNPGVGPLDANTKTTAGIPGATATAPLKNSGYTTADIGFATDLGPTQVLGRCKPDGTCFQ